jgi:hypothetical protein
MPLRPPTATRPSHRWTSRDFVSSFECIFAFLVISRPGRERGGAGSGARRPGDASRLAPRVRCCTRSATRATAERASHESLVCQRCLASCPVTQPHCIRGPHNSRDVASDARGKASAIVDSHNHRKSLVNVRPSGPAFMQNSSIVSILSDPPPIDDASATIDRGRESRHRAPAGLALRTFPSRPDSRKEALRNPRAAVRRTGDADQRVW